MIEVRKWHSALSDFEKLARVIQHGLQGFVVKKIEGESTEANE